MVIQKIVGNLAILPAGDRKLDWLDLEWHELPKRILRKRTRGGQEVSLKFLNGKVVLTQDDVIYLDENALIAIDVLPCETLIIRPKSMFEMASVCYEIGNKHLPLFYEEDAVAVPEEPSLYRLLTAAGYEVQKKSMKLLHPLQTSVAAHPHENGTSLFGKIMQLTHANG